MDCWKSELHTTLLSLLRSGLWGKPEMAGVCMLNPDQWAELYRYARQHTIEGIVFDGIQHLPAAFLPPRDLLLKWTVRIDQIERRNHQMNSVIREQLEIFKRLGIIPVLLKGQGVASCYLKPNHRVCGDVDWYFEQKGDYKQINELLRRRGFYISEAAGFSTEYTWKGIVIEHHTRMFDIHNPLSFAFLDRLQKQFYDQKLKREVDENMLTLPAPLLLVLQVNVHILKHLLSFGVGVRQLCDAARVYYTFQQNMDGQQLKQIYQTLGILKWIHLLHAILVKFIGLPLQSLPFELPENINADWMMEEIWTSGNFGFFHSRFKEHVLSGRGRTQKPQRIWSNVRKYFRFAPMEAISFPVVQFYSKLAVK